MKHLSHHYIHVFISLTMLASCDLPFIKNDKGPLKYSDPTLILSEKKKVQELEVQKQKEALEKARKIKKRYEEDKKLAFEEITTLASTNYKSSIEPIFKNKCINCHDASFKMPLYGKILPKINPVHQHQEDGLKALNFEKGYPFIAQGNPPVISILKAIKTTTEEKTMPIKSFLKVYPKKALSKEEQETILNWINPLIEKIESYETKFSRSTETEKPADKVAISFGNSCLRCHGNGNAKGGFGNIENLESVLKSKYVDQNNLDESKLVKVLEDGSMPPGKLEKLSPDEIFEVKEWLESEANKN